MEIYYRINVSGYLTIQRPTEEDNRRNTKRENDRTEDDEYEQWSGDTRQGTADGRTEHFTQIKSANFSNKNSPFIFIMSAMKSLGILRFFSK